MFKLPDGSLRLIVQGWRACASTDRPDAPYLRAR
jgi:hypothetical protein